MGATHSCVAPIRRPPAVPTRSRRIGRTRWLRTYTLFQKKRATSARYFLAERVGLIRAIHGPDFRCTKAPEGVPIRSKLGILPRKEPGLRHPWLRRSLAQCTHCVFQLTPANWSNPVRSNLHPLAKKRAPNGTRIFLAERVGLGHSLREFPANLQLRCCVGRTGVRTPIPHSAGKTKSPLWGAFWFFWRRGWDSNPRYG